MNTLKYISFTLDGLLAVGLGLATGALILLLIGGCVLTQYHRKVITDPQQKVLSTETSFNYFKANVNDQKEGVDVNLPDGVRFKADKIVTIADPNSARAEGEAIGNVLKGTIR